MRKLMPINEYGQMKRLSVIFLSSMIFVVLSIGTAFSGFWDYVEAVTDGIKEGVSESVSDHNKEYGQGSAQMLKNDKKFMCGACEGRGWTKACDNCDRVKCQNCDGKGYVWGLK